MRPHPAIVRASPKGSKGSIGAVDSAHFAVEGLLRSHLSELETKYGTKFEVDDRLIPWLVRHIAGV